MAEWASLRDAYGSAERLPEVLAAAAAAGMAEHHSWVDLWGHLYHQGTVYTASYAALPALTDMSRRHAPAGYVAALHLAAAIIAATEGAEDPVRVRQRYERELTELHAIAVRNLQHAKDDIEFVYGLQTLMAFENGGVWQRNLVWLANGEAEVDCPDCGEHLLLDLEGPDFQAASFADTFVKPTPVTPVKPAAGTVEDRLRGLALAHDRPLLASRLRYLFGDATCPRCNVPFPVPQKFT